MARQYGRTHTARWSIDDDWRSLTVAEQWCYDMLCSNAKITLCGLLEQKLTVWAGYARDVDVRTLTALLEDLEQLRYIGWDRGTEEILVRTFSKHDGAFTGGKNGLGNVNLGKGVWNAIGCIQSRDLMLMALENLPPEAFEQRFNPPAQLLDKLGITLSTEAGSKQLPKQVRSSLVSSFELPHPHPTTTTSSPPTGSRGAEASEDDEANPHDPVTDDRVQALHDRLRARGLTVEVPE